jgi:HEPN domain-containing protein
MMSNRAQDWFRQAQADFQHAGNALISGDYEWSCFAAQQAAEKAVKAVFQDRGLEAWGHTISALLGGLGGQIAVAESLLESAKILDKHYIPTRYPNGFDSGAPTDFYTRSEAQAALGHAEEILGFCENHLGFSGEG